MRKQEFLDTLEQLLWDLEEQDRREAMQYYIDYFEDAGISEEEDVIGEFGRPEKVAARIKVELTEEHSEYSEQGFEDVRFEDDKKLMLEQTAVNDRRGAWETVGEDVLQKTGSDKKKREPDIWKVVVIVLLAMAAAPIVLPVLLGIFVLIAGLLVGAVSLILGLLVSVIAVVASVGFGGLLSGVILLIHGFFRLFSAPAAGALLLGLGGVSAAIGVVGLWLFVWLFVKIFPRFLRGVINFLTRVFNKGGEKE